MFGVVCLSWPNSVVGSLDVAVDLQRVEMCERCVTCQNVKMQCDAELSADIDKKKADNKDKQIALVEKFAMVMTCIHSDSTSQDPQIAVYGSVV